MILQLSEHSILKFKDIFKSFKLAL